MGFRSGASSHLRLLSVLRIHGDQDEEISQFQNELETEQGLPKHGGRIGRSHRLRAVEWGGKRLQFRGIRSDPSSLVTPAPLNVATSSTEK